MEEEACDLGGEAFTRFMDTLYDQLSALVNSSEVSDNLGAVRAIDELIDVRLGETATKIAKFAEYLKKIFEEKQDPEVLIAASVALGHLAKVGGALTADVVEYQVCYPWQVAGLKQMCNWIVILYMYDAEWCSNLGCGDVFVTIKNIF